MIFKNKTGKKKPSQKRKSIKRQTAGKKINHIKHTNNRNKSHIVKVFLEVLNMVKLYHWKTHSYAQHKATDELYERLNENIDKFVEILLGKDESRIKMLEKRIDLVDANNVKDFKSRIYEYRTFLIDINMYFDTKRDSDLLSLRDEILGNVNQFLYLMTFDK
jgi:DNA-binding ferritin-like protein